MGGGKIRYNYSSCHLTLIHCDCPLPTFAFASSWKPDLLKSRRRHSFRKRMCQERYYASTSSAAPPAILGGSCLFIRAVGILVMLVCLGPWASHSALRSREWMRGGAKAGREGAATECLSQGPPKWQRPLSYDRKITAFLLECKCL